MTLFATAILLLSSTQPPTQDLCHAVDAACLTQVSMSPSGPEMQVEDPRYLRLVGRGMSVVPELIELLADPTETEQQVPLFGGRWAVGDIARSVLGQIAPDVPWLALVTGRLDWDNDPQYSSCGFCAYWNHVRESPANRSALRDEVRAWFAENTGRLHWKADPQLLTKGAYVLVEAPTGDFHGKLTVFVELGTREEEEDLDRRAFRVVVGRRVLVRDLELGDSPEGGFIELAWDVAPVTGWTVQFQVETSATIQDEGPHLDLVDWKHGTTEWRDLERVSSRRFLMPTLTDEEQARFPTFEPEELAAAVRVAGGEEWLERMRLGAGPDIGVSVIRLRVIDPEAPERPFVIEFLIPMGC